MALYIARHAKAEAYAATEDARPLAPEGRDAAQRVGTRLAAAGVSVGTIYHSGLVRARETAEILAGSLEPAPLVRRQTGLRPEDSPALLRPWLQSVTEQGDVMLVSHMPFVQALTSYLLLADDRWPLVDFKTGAVARMDPIGGQRWTLSWLLTPKLAS